MMEGDGVLRERYLQLKHEKEAFTKRQDDLEHAYNEANDKSQEQAQTIAALERRLREQIRLAEERAQDAEIAAQLNEELEHMHTELVRTKQTLNVTSSELDEVKQEIAVQALEDEELASQYSEGLSALSSTHPSDRGHEASDSDVDLDDDDAGPPAVGPALVAVDPVMLAQQQEEIARLRDMLDEEAHRRQTLEMEVRRNSEDGLLDLSLADELGSMSLADELGGGGGGMSLADELSGVAAPTPAPAVPVGEESEGDEELPQTPPKTPPAEPVFDPTSEDERMAMQLMAQFQEEELRRRRELEERMANDAKLAKEVNTTEEQQHSSREREAQRRKEDDERMAKEVVSEEEAELRSRQEEASRLAMEDALLAQQIGLSEVPQVTPTPTLAGNRSAHALHRAFPEFDLSAIEAMLLANGGDQKKTKRELEQLKAASTPATAAAAAAAPAQTARVASPKRTFKERQQELIRMKQLRMRQAEDEAAERAAKARMNANLRTKRASMDWQQPSHAAAAVPQQPSYFRKTSTDFRIVMPSQERVFVALMQDDECGYARNLGLGTLFDGRMAIKCTPSAVTLNPDVRRQHRMDDHSKRREWRLQEIREVHYEGRSLFLSVWISNNHSEIFEFKLTEHADSAKDAFTIIHKFMTDMTDRTDSSLARDMQKAELGDQWQSMGTEFMAELRFNEEFLEILAKETQSTKQQLKVDPATFARQLDKMGDKSRKKMIALQKKVQKRDAKGEKKELKTQKKELKRERKATIKKEKRKSKQNPAIEPGSDDLYTTDNTSASASSVGAGAARVATSPLPPVPATGPMPLARVAGASIDPGYEHLYAQIAEETSATIAFPHFVDPTASPARQAW